MGVAAPGRAAWARALAVPAGVVLLTVTVLSYSRTTLIVVVVIAAAWLLLVRGRLWAVALMALTGAGAIVLSAWALARPALTGDNQLLAARTSAGHTYGVDLPDRAAAGHSGRVGAGRPPSSAARSARSAAGDRAGRCWPGWPCCRC